MHNVYNKCVNKSVKNMNYKPNNVHEYSDLHFNRKVINIINI